MGGFDECIDALENVLRIAPVIVATAQNRYTSGLANAAWQANIDTHQAHLQRFYHNKILGIQT